MMLLFHGLCYSVEFSVVALTFILSFDFLFQFYESNKFRDIIVTSANCNCIVNETAEVTDYRTYFYLFNHRSY